jgi:diacylglycerol kinase family enzyme
MKVFHILNPSRLRVDRVRALIDGRRLKWPWAWVTREHTDHTETLVQWAVTEGITRLVVWGGDGTLHRVVDHLRKRNALDRVEVALVPVGTCNDLARRMGLTADMYERWESDELSGKPASLAIGEMTVKGSGGGTSVFINNAGFGRPKESFDRKDPPLKTLASFRPIATSAGWVDGELKGLYYMALVCLGPYFSGGLHFEADPSPEDALIRAYLVPARSKARLAARLLAGRLGLPLKDDKVTKITADVLRVKTDATVWPQVDGEPPAAEGARDMEFRVLPERWRLWGGR